MKCGRTDDQTGELDRSGVGSYSGRRMPIDIRAHITGTVWKIEISVGDSVAEGQTLVILESMKMEMPVEAPSAGTVSAIQAKEGAAVEEGAVLLTLEP